MEAIRGKTRPLPIAVGIDAKMNASIHNRFDIEVIDTTTREIKQRAQAENIITNTLWECYTQAWSSYIQFGSGSGTPAVSDKALFGYVAGKLATINSENIDYGTYSLKKKIVLSESENVGVNLSEVGLSPSSSGSLCTHAMLQDMNGNKITINKSATDIINIYATIFVHFSTNSFYTIYNNYRIESNNYVGNVDLFKVLCGNGPYIANYPIFFNKVALSSTKNILNFNTSVDVSTSYDSATRQIKTNTVRFSAGTANLKDLVGVCLAYFNRDWGYNQYTEFCYINLDSLWYSGSNITGEAIGTGDGVTKDFVTAFSKISNLKVYVNGVQETAITFDADIPAFYKWSDMGDAYAFYRSEAILCPVEFDTNGNEQFPVYLGAAGKVLYKNMIFKNIYYETVGIAKIVYIPTSYSGISKVQVSDDGKVWIDLTGITNSANGYTYVFATVPDVYKHYKYIKFVVPDYVKASPNFMVAVDKTMYNVHFATAPSSGAPITADYHTATIAKDSNHVFDFSMTIQLGEHTA